MLSFLHTFFTMKTWLPEYRVTKLLLDAAHDADAVYRYCQESGIQPFIDLNSGNTGNFIYKDTFTINNDGVPVCKLGLHMRPDGVERNRNRCKWRCPKADDPVVTAKLPVQIPLMGVWYIHLSKTSHASLTYRQETV